MTSCCHQELFRRTQAAGAIRADVEPNDISMLFEQISNVHLGDEKRTRELRQRYLALALDGLRSDTGTSLPGRPPDWSEISGRWNPLPGARSRRRPT